MRTPLGRGVYSLVQGEVLVQQQILGDMVVDMVSFELYILMHIYGLMYDKL